MCTDRKAQRRQHVASSSTSLTQYDLGIKEGDVDRDLILNGIQKMSKKKSDIGRRRSTRTRRKIAGRSVSPAVDRPGWLPEDWTMELKKRVKSCTKRKRIDRYYICPLSGKRLRSRLEVMRVLNNKFLDHSASESAPPRDGGYRQPTVELERSEVKRTIARRNLFAREEPLSDAITGGDSTQEPALSSLTLASAQLDNGASETSYLTPKNIEHLGQMACESQPECEPNPMVHIEEQPAIKVLLEPGNEKLSEPMVHAEGEIPVPDANLSEEAQFELTKKRSQPQSQKGHDSSNTEAVGSVNNVRSLPERPETDELKEKLEVAEPFVEQDSQEQHHHNNDPLRNTLPFGDSWSDPCIEFAFKTLTSDFPVLEDIAAIQDYFNHQHVSSQSPNPSVGPSSSLLGGPSSLFRDDDDKRRPLQTGKAELSNPTSKKTM